MACIGWCERQCLDFCLCRYTLSKCSSWTCTNVLLEFAEGHPLGKTGFHWLKIHLANVYGNGVDKFSFEGRLAFVEKNMDNILDSANKPLEGRRWWLAAEDPFQCLATCMEISSALSSTNLETYCSYLPIHQVRFCLSFCEHRSLFLKSLFLKWHW